MDAFDADNSSKKRGGFVKAGGGVEVYEPSSHQSRTNKDDFTVSMVDLS